MELEQILERCEELYEDLDLECVRAWKQCHPGAAAIGFLPTYVPREIIHAAGALPVGVLGGGDRLEIVKGDACFQSYICHLPRSVVELGMSGKLDVLDGMIFPSTCDVIRNLSGIWQMQFPGQYCKYFDVPQNFERGVGGAYYRAILAELCADMARLTGHPVSDGALRESIRAYNQNRALVQRLYRMRASEPWRARSSEAYLLLRAGMLLDVEQHSRLLRAYLELLQIADRHPFDNARVVLTGVFCEQPPLTMIRTLERAGCDVVEDDLLLVMRWLGSAVAEEGDPLDSLVEAYLGCDGETSSRYLPDGLTKGQRLVESVRRSGAEGVVFAAPSFCDPALLDRPMLQNALAEAGIAYTALTYSENTGQMQPIREQAGTFADTLKLWEDA